jgi:predicted metal-dependent phosphoesterase TrpH
VVRAEESTDLDAIAITDHDAIAGAWTREVASRRGSRIQVFVGMEVTTRQGHLLALGIEKPVRMLQDIDTTIALIHEQGGLCVLPHPLAWFSMGARRATVDRLARQNDNGTHLDGLEVFNPSFAGRVTYQQVQKLNASRWKLATCGGSDSHALHTIGSAFTIFPGSPTLAGLRAAMVERSVGFGGQFWSVEDHTSIAIPQLYRSMILTPVARVRRSRAWLRDEKEAASNGKDSHPGGVG